MNRSEQLALFDIDGTLLRRAGPHHKNALIAGVQKITGQRPSFDGIEAAGTLDRDLIILLLQTIGLPVDEIESTLLDMIPACEEYYLANCANDLRGCLCPGVPELLKRLTDSGCVLGVVTGNFSKIGWKKLELAALRAFFSVGAFSHDGRARSELAAMAAERAREENLVTRTSRIALIGDHPNDVEAAKANGFRSIAVATGFSSVDELRAFNPDVVVPDLLSIQSSEIFQEELR